MTNQQINKAIAELRGWKWERLWTGELHGKPIGEQGPLRELLDYCNDLNAMHDAVSIFDYDQADEFEEYLCDICKRLNDEKENPAPWRFAVVNATAAQRAEAFLRVIGKWEVLK